MDVSVMADGAAPRLRCPVKCLLPGMKSTFRLLLITPLLVLLMKGTTDAEASQESTVSSSTDILTTIPDCIILHYYASIVLNFEQMLQPAESGSSGIWKATWAGDARGENELLHQTGESAIPNIVTVTLSNVWAVRGFSSTGSARVTIAPEISRLTSGTAVIVIAEGTGENLEIDDNAGQKGSSISTGLRGIGKTTATIGNVKMPLNFTGATKAGLYSGGLYKITAETI